MYDNKRARLTFGYSSSTAVIMYGIRKPAKRSPPAVGKEGLSFCETAFGWFSTFPLQKKEWVTLLWAWLMLHSLERVSMSIGLRNRRCLTKS